MSLISIKKSLNRKTREFIPGTFENTVLNRDKILATYEKKPKVNDLIVSMTTYAPRINSFEYSILSILAGSVLPEKIYVYVPKGFLSLLAGNDSFLRPEYDKGLITLVEMERDYFCHSKYYYSVLNYGHAKDILIGDDDVIYYKDWVKHIVESARKYPDYSVFAYKALEVKVVNDKIEPFDDWPRCSKYCPGQDKLLFAEGVGGVLYKKGSLEKEALNTEKFLELAPKADDVWLWFCACLNKCKIKYISPRKKLLYVVPGSQESALWIDNVIGKKTDIYVENCRRYFSDKYGLDITRLNL
ncbi:MAG: hypothetical protein LBH19_11295 [Dysgonamonadaceae bacterium]|jgi:hypothetical protein|nr:hypothetical protein [Dysgonamonadaceae bacterium]